MLQACWQTVDLKVDRHFGEGQLFLTHAFKQFVRLLGRIRIGGWSPALQ